MWVKTVQENNNSKFCKYANAKIISFVYKVISAYMRMAGDTANCHVKASSLFQQDNTKPHFCTYCNSIAL